jgi:hypothetical protein
MKKTDKKDTEQPLNKKKDEKQAKKKKVTKETTKPQLPVSDSNA